MAVFGLTNPLGLLVLLRILMGKGSQDEDGGGLAEPSVPTTGPPAVPKGSFPSSPPALPAWPKGWCPDVPVPPEVRARGWALLPELWAKGEGTRKVEMVGGRWITFVAAIANGQKAVGAFRSVNCEAVYPEGLATEQAADSAAKALLDSAITMNEALKLRGYKKADMRLYQDFQRRAGLGADGYPGTVTMLKFESVLKGGGQTMAPVRVYPWKASGKYDGVNAPTSAEWEGAGVPASSPIAQAPGKAPPAAAPPRVSPPPISPTPYRAPAPAVYTAPPATPYAPVTMTNTQVQHALNVLGYKGADGAPLKEDGIIGTQSKFAIAAFQRGHPPLAVDSIAGPQTKSMLGAALAMQAANVSQGAPSYIPAAAPTMPTVSSNVDVQHALNRLGYLGKDGKPLTEDGILGTNSKFAIAAFQKEHPPLKVDSIAGTQTKAALANALMSAAA